MGRFRVLLRTSFAAFAVTACGDQDPSSLTSPQLPDPSEGAVAFETECAGCHGSGDGFDLALFGFPDSTIVRRATAHVDTATALDLVAHVRTLAVAPLDRRARPFQPLGGAVDDDVAFALAVFGADAWPAGMNESQLAALDPRRIAAALPFPLWSDEESNLDWMPDLPLPDDLLAAQGGWGAASLAGYHAVPTDQNLLRAVSALRRLASDRSSVSAPCRIVDDEGTIADPESCFNATRWIAALGAQHMLRFGGVLSDGRAVHDAFWDVGMAARRSLVKNRDPVDNARANWALWMYVGWTFEPGRHASTYTSTGLANLGLVRHAAFVALRSLVERSPGSTAPFKDLAVLAGRAPNHWLESAFQTGLGVLEARQERGWNPLSAEARNEAAAALEQAARLLDRRVDDMRLAPLSDRARSLAAGLAAPAG